MADQFLFSNNASSTLASGITAGATTVFLATGTGVLFPSPAAGQRFALTLADSSGNIEVAHCTARSTDTLTVVRAQEGTTGLAFLTGDAAELRITKAVLDEFFTDTLGALKAPLASPAFTGAPTAPTQAAGNNTTRIATTEFVQTAAKKGAFTNNSNGNSNISDVSIDIVPNGSGSWLSYGATGAGATYTWTALDGIPTDVDWIEVKIQITGSPSGSYSYFVTAYARDIGGAEVPALDNVVGYQSEFPAGAANIVSLSFSKIPVTSRKFEMLHNANTATRYIELILIGYGYN